MDDSDKNPLKNTPVNDSSLWKKAIEKLEGSNILAVLFLLICSVVCGIIMFKVLEWQEVVLVMFLLACCVIVVAISFNAGKHQKKKSS